MFLRAISATLLVLVLLGPSRALAGPALVFDPYKGTILYQADMDALWHPA